MLKEIETVKAALAEAKVSDNATQQILSAEQARAEALEAEKAEMLKEIETVKAALAEAKVSDNATQQILSAEQVRAEALEAEKAALIKEAEAIKADFMQAKAADDETKEKLTAAQAKSVELETAVREKTEELLKAQKELEKLRSDLIYQDRMERIAYAHTNTFFIMEEKMGRFYRDAMCASDTKTGF